MMGGILDEWVISRRREVGHFGTSEAVLCRTLVA